MARYYGLPAGLGWGGTKAKQPEAQSAYENTLGMVLEMLAGADFLFGAGLLDSVQQMSLEELVIADEVFGMVTRLLRGVAVDRETLAVDLIKKLGFDGDYLLRAATPAPTCASSGRRASARPAPTTSWQSAGSPRLEDKARAVADGILASPAPEFPEELGARVRRHHRRGRVRPLLKGALHGLRRQVLRRQARQARAALAGRRPADPRGDPRRHRERGRQVPLAEGPRHPRGATAPRSTARRRWPGSRPPSSRRR